MADQPLEETLGPSLDPLPASVRKQLHVLGELVRAERAPRPRPAPITERSQVEEQRPVLASRRRSTHTVAADLVAASLATLVPLGGWVLAGDLPALALAAAPVAVALWLGCLLLSRAYEPRFLWSGSAELQRVIAAAAAFTVVVLAVGWALLPAQWAGGALLLVTLLCATTGAARRVVRARAHAAHRAGAVSVRVLAVGPADDVRLLSQRMHRDRYHGWHVVAACTPDRPEPDVSTPVRLGAVRDVVAASERCHADVVMLCPGLGLAEIEDLRGLQAQLEAAGRELAIAPPLVEAIGPRVSLSAVCGLPVVRLDRPELDGPRRVLKAIADRVVSALALLVLAPVLVGIGAAVRLDSTGPALFRQTRMGKDGTTFTMLKFRTMRTDAEQRRAELLDADEGAGLLFKLKADPRVTRVGAWLRRTSLDELPQLVNVVRGEMSLVGPRPSLPVEAAEYDRFIARRLLVRPGLTGLWQVSGRSDLSWRESRRLDVRYVENWSLGFDLTILVRTVDVVLRRRGAY
ncbi:exopolysaccharide biosynthesis polyprenyl glycosylphosphotransferase [Aquipuribacter nitratireducens]|uniref:Sugar transferase n=1 Tax=Aquipuribacter nitratireducens TaxID=650104 RepID=A0ABW0GPH5_9MICO